MALTLTTAENILKVNYQGGIREQLGNSCPLLGVVKRDLTKSRFHGLYAHVPLHNARNVGVGARAENAVLPTEGAQGYAAAIYNMAYLYGKIGITGQAIEAMADDMGAFARAVDSEMKGLRRDLKRDQNRQLMHDGSGLLTNITGANTGTSVPVSDSKYLKAGQKVLFAARADGAGAESLTISSITSDTAIVMTTTPTTTTSSDGVYADGARSASDWDQPFEMWGINAIVSDSNPTNLGATPADSNTIGRISRAAAGNGYWKANAVDASGAVLDDTLDKFQEAYDLAEIEGDSEPGIIITSHACRRAYGGVLTPLRQFDDTLELRGGWKGLKFGNAAIIPDRDASTPNDPKNAALADFDLVYFIASDALELQVLLDYKWEDRGGILRQAGVGANAVDRVEAFMKAYLNLIAVRPNACTVLSGLNI